MSFFCPECSTLSPLRTKSKVLAGFLKTETISCPRPISVTLPPTIKSAIESKLKQEQEALEYEFKLEKAAQEAERQRVEAEGKAKANSIVSASITDKILRDKGIEATLKLAESPNSKVVIIGGNDGMPIILGDVK